jgi:hypothetical protein
MELLIVMVILAIITWLFRFFGLKYYYYLREKENQEFLEHSQITDEELIVILAAAAQMVLCKSVVVKSIRFVKNQNDTAWARMGKLHIMSSHHLR